jgi:hypothetical protein
MQRDSRKIFLGLMLLLLMPFMASAQTSSINAYSPYSMYGMGELLTPGSAQMRSMGGVGIAVRNYGEINVLNPAAASVAPQKSFLFDVGFDGTYFVNTQPKYDGNGVALDPVTTAYKTGNIHNIALTFPLAQRVGLSFSIAPYSSVGYKIQTTDQNEDNWADIGRVRYSHNGEGDISEVKLSLGWAPWQKFSIGVAARYYWGNVTRTYEATAANVITGSGVYASTKGVDNYVVSNVKFQLGLQWCPIQNDTKSFTLGATYDFGGNLNPEESNYVYTDNVINSIQANPVRNRIEALELRVPQQVGVGMFFRNRKMACGADYLYAMWGSNNADYAENTTPSTVDVSYEDTHTVKLGFEFTPRSGDVRNYLNRIAYRVGARVGNYYQTFGGERVNTIALTAGFGLPLKIWGISTMNIGFEYGQMSSKNPIQVDAKKVGLVRQNSFKITLGFSLFSADTADYWFVKQKYD